MKKGFTLIELLVVMAILGILSSVVVASIDSARGKGDRENAQYIVKFEGSRHYVESYTKEDNGQCVYLSEEEKRFCGDWSVEKINKEEE